MSRSWKLAVVTGLARFGIATLQNTAYHRSYAQCIFHVTARRAACSQRELLLTESEREVSAAAVQALLSRNVSLRTNDELIEEELRADPEFRAEWERTVVGRAVALAIIRYRAEHDLSQPELAERLGLTWRDLADIERGDVNPPPDTVERIASQLGSGSRLTGLHLTCTSVGSESIDPWPNNHARKICDSS